MQEELLLQQLRARRPEALEQLIRCYNAYVAAIIRGILGAACSEEDVEELVSDVFVAIWRHADALKPGKVKAYIGTAARNTAKSFLRKKRILPMDLDELPGLAAPGTPEEHCLAREQAELVRAAWEQMGDAYWGAYDRAAGLESAAAYTELDARVAYTRSWSAAIGDLAHTTAVVLLDGSELSLADAQSSSRDGDDVVSWMTEEFTLPALVDLSQVAGLRIGAQTFAVVS